jgi:hypothetical protein
MSSSRAVQLSGTNGVFLEQSTGDRVENQKDHQIMNAQLKYSACRALAVAIVCAYALMVLPAPVLAAKFTAFCKATNVAVLALTGHNYFHVECEQADPNRIKWFAFSLDLGSNTDRLLSLATTAVVTHRGLLIHYDLDDHSLENFGCQRINCRRIEGMVLLN